ncbi:MAG: amino acid permease [Terriglobia bacterium]|jgi:APA family basic amino acid/polyamine antiporter|nr:amino acid permease [Terriglobia bacterium]
MNYSEAASKPVAGNTRPERKAGLVRAMSLPDAVLLIVGGTIGTGIFLTSNEVAAATRIPIIFIGAWLAGMVVTWLASISVAELGSMFPDAGGQYVYLREAYGELVGFLYGWMIFSINVCGSLAAISVGFAYYMGAIIPQLHASRPIITILGFTLNCGHVVAIAAIVFLTWINIIGLRPAVLLQNLATWVKFGALGAFLLLGFALGHGNWSNFTHTPIEHYDSRTLLSGFGVALIAVFWVYDGWVYITWVAGEVKRPERNVPRSLILSVLIIGALVVGANVLYLYAMPLSAISQQPTVAEAAAQTLFFPAAGRLMGMLVAVSAFGAAAACVMSGARVYYAMARDGIFFQKLAEVHPRWHTPVFSLVLQCVWSCALVLLGRYDELFTYAMFISVIAYAAAASTIFVFRRTRPDLPRDYKCPGYPWVPILYCVICGAWALNTFWERPVQALGGIAIMLLGTPAYFYWRNLKRQANRTA